ncbi:MAG: cation:proton antiporter [Dehalococcoides mccartyi]|nr:cation:proton antiporter [Dehalococcoides mccartyi]MBF4482839.1 cation:proton antiporter [Dehalococcoides mccartyi]MBJ7532161.1 cation:proton antiporter [Dehalococcoides mccartyi]MDN4185740.1 cation:proton antiporter [Dehalococcoides mccartyi]
METEIYFKFILSFGLILLVARLGGAFAERFLKQPAVIGELLAGIIISPFLLGHFLFANDPVILNFALIDGVFSQNGEHLSEFAPMEIISQIAVVVLLFVAGLETNVASFIKNSFTGAMVAIGGVVVPFALGVFGAMYFFPDLHIAGWLFIGAILTATSIGITVRILMDMGKLSSREGTIILVAAVVDDIIGLVILSVVISMAQSGSINALSAIGTGVIGFAVWLGILLLGVYGHKYISKYILTPFKASGTMPVMALIVGLLVSYMVTLVGLHPVVGAYVAGLMFASTAEKEEILHQTRPIMLFIAPFFFAYLGMQVDLKEVWAVIVPALVIVVLAIIGKIIGCYFPARFVGKTSHKGALIVGVGMVPRGEVGLIVAGAGLIAGAITRDLFGIAVAVSILTTLVMPLMIKPLFKPKAEANGKELP